MKRRKLKKSAKWLQVCAAQAGFMRSFDQCVDELVTETVMLEQSYPIRARSWWCVAYELACGYRDAALELGHDSRRAQRTA